MDDNSNTVRLDSVSLSTEHPNEGANVSRDFRFHIPLTAWQKSGEDNPLRIGGIVSTDDLDRQQEVILQDGLDFSPFLAHGWFNDNHGQKTGDVLGYPTGAMRVHKGCLLYTSDAADE